MIVWRYKQTQHVDYYKIYVMSFIAPGRFFCTVLSGEVTRKPCLLKG